MTFLAPEYVEETSSLIHANFLAEAKLHALHTYLTDKYK